MNRAEYEVILNRILAVESRCELLEAELKVLKAAPLEAMVAAEHERITSKGKQKGF